VYQTGSGLSIVPEWVSPGLRQPVDQARLHGLGDRGADGAHAAHDFRMQPGDDLYGLHSGTALTERSVEAPPDLPDQIMLFRGPLFRLAGPGASLHPTRRKRTKERETLREQVRITLLHEIGHHFGLDEEDLDRLGYA